MSRVVQGYELGAKLGSGLQGKVYKARHITTGEEVAVKLIPFPAVADERARKRILTEIQALSLVSSHRHIVGMRGAFMDVEKPKKRRPGQTMRCIMIVMEFAPGGELYSYLSTAPVHSPTPHFTGLPEPVARVYAHQLFSALAWAGGKDVAHRDLKPENLLLDACLGLKVADWGLSAVCSNIETDVLRTACGTPAYMSPEVQARRGYVGAASDVWSAGVILFILLSGFPPFEAARAGDWWYDRLAAGQNPYFWQAHERSATFSPTSKDLINRMLVVNPAGRATIEAVLGHDFFKGHVATPSEVAREMCGRRAAFLKADGKPADALCVADAVAAAIAGATAAAVDAVAGFSGGAPEDAAPAHASPAGGSLSGGGVAPALALGAVPAAASHATLYVSLSAGSERTPSGGSGSGGAELSLSASLGGGSGVSSPSYAPPSVLGRSRSAMEDDDDEQDSAFMEAATRGPAPKPAAGASTAPPPPGAPAPPAAPSPVARKAAAGPKMLASAASSSSPRMLSALSVSAADEPVPALPAGRPGLFVPAAATLATIAGARHALASPSSRPHVHESFGAGSPASSPPAAPAAAPALPTLRGGPTIPAGLGLIAPPAEAAERIHETALLLRINDESSSAALTGAALGAAITRVAARICAVVPDTTADAAKVNVAEGGDAVAVKVGLSIPGALTAQRAALRFYAAPGGGVLLEAVRVSGNPATFSAWLARVRAALSAAGLLSGEEGGIPAAPAHEPHGMGAVGAAAAVADGSDDGVGLEALAGAFATALSVEPAQAVPVVPAMNDYDKSVGPSVPLL